MDATPEQAEKIYRDMQMSPRQVADAPSHIEPIPEPLPVLVPPIKDIRAPDFQNALRAGLDRELIAEPRVGSMAELKQMVDRGAPTEELLKHPAVQKAIRETYYERGPSMTPEEFGDAEWRAKRVYEFQRPDGTIEKVQGWDAAVSRLADEAKAFAGGEFKNGSHAIIVLGPPAAGKSTVSETLAKKYGAAIVDPDEAKKVIPGYESGSGAGSTHYESVELAKAAFKEIGRDHGNIILPKVGQHPDIIRPMIRDLKARGYTVDLVHVSVPIEVSQRRNIGRFLETGRLVDPNYIAETGEKPLETTHILSGEANEVAYVNNLEKTVEGTGPLADSIRSGLDVGPSIRGGREGAPGGGRTEEGRYPTAVDANGNVSYQPIQKALDEIDAYKTAADQIAACVSPAAEGVPA
jgi:predicted ABC-type ATPase